MERSLTVTSTDGLANRLRVLCSGLVVAEATNRGFSMVWPTAGQDCAIGFHELFSNDWPVVDSVEPHDESAWDDPEPFDAIPNIESSPKDHLRVCHFASLITGRLSNHRELQRRADELFATLLPRPHLQDRIEQLSATFDGFTIGAHVRRGDFHVTEPSVVGNLEAAISAVTEQAGALRAGTPWTVFLATDDGAPHQLGKGNSTVNQTGVRQSFRGAFGDHLRECEPRSLDRASPAALEDALVDLWLLRKCHTVVGTSRSSFTETAVTGRDAQLIRVGGTERSPSFAQRILVSSGAYRLVGKVARRRLGYRPPPHRLASWIRAEILHVVKEVHRRTLRVRQQFG